MFDFPVFLPSSSILLRNPGNPESVHPLLPKMKLIACKFSANMYLQTNFRQILSTLCSPVGRQARSGTLLQSFDSSALSVSSVLNFLASLYERGIGHSQIYKVRSALSNTPTLQSANTHLFHGLLKGYEPALWTDEISFLLWNAQDLIRYLASWNLSSDDSIQETSRKLAAALACVSAQRVHTLLLIGSRHIFFFDSGMYLYIFSDLKVQHNRPCFVITLPFESESDYLKTVELLQLYLNKTRLIRKH